MNPCRDCTRQRPCHACTETEELECAYCGRLTDKLDLVTVDTEDFCSEEHARLFFREVEAARESVEVRA